MGVDILVKLLIICLIAGLCESWSCRKGYAPHTWFWATLLMGYNWFILPIITIGLLKDRRKLATESGGVLPPEVLARGAKLGVAYMTIGILIKLVMLAVSIGAPADLVLIGLI